MTKNDRFVVSGFYDNSVKVWNFDKIVHKSMPETSEMLNGFYVSTNDNKYKVSVFNGFDIKVWNLIEKKLETV